MTEQHSNDRIWTDAQKIPVARIGRHIPSARRDGGIDPSTAYRWVHRGLRAADGRVVKLEAVRVGGQWITSVEAVQRWVAALNDAGITPELPVKGRTEAKRKAASAWAKERLARNRA